MRKFITMLFVLFLGHFSLYAQVKTIQGRILDDNNQPVPYATIRISNSRVGASADEAGHFSIKAKAGDVLIISGVNIIAKSVPVTFGKSMEINILRRSSILSEVVVTSLGIKKEAKSLGYSAATVTGEELNVSKPINVAQALIGRVSGAQINVIDNGVNPDVRIQLRGERHINADNSALIVVDGMEVRSDYLTSLNPEDIDNVSVLKGASAAALYGSEATNGVMIVTTRRGSRNGRAVINFISTTTIENMAYFPKLQSTYSGYGGESGNFFFGSASNPYTGFVNYIPFENQQYGPAFNGSAANSYIGGPNEQGKLDSTPFYGISPDQRRKFFVTGVTTQNELSFTSGDAANSNFISLQDVNVGGVTPKDMYRKDGVRIGGKRTYGIFSIDYSVNYSYQYQNTSGGDFNGNPVYWNVLNTPANIPLTSLKDWQDPNSFANPSNYYNAYYTNPYWQLDNSRNTSKNDNFQGGLIMNLKPTSWFQATYRLGAQTTTNVNKNWVNGIEFSSYSRSDPWQASNYQSSGNKAGSVSDYVYYYKRLQQDIFLTFNRKFGDLGSTLILGNTIWDHYSDYQGQSNSNLYIPGLYNISYSTGIPSVGQSVSSTRLIGAYGDLSLNYKDYLFLHGNFRRDYSSLLATGNNHYNVWGVDAAWSFVDVIPALKMANSILSFGKIRAAYSQTGQITLSPYSTVNTYGVTGGYPDGSVASLSLSGTYNNPTLKPEQTNEKEAGIDLGFLRNHINIGVTTYYDDNIRQLFPVSLSSSSGYFNANVNAASTTSKGWEFDAKLTPLIRTSGGFRWDLNGNLAIQTTIVKQLYDSAQNFGIGNANAAIVGQAFPTLYVSDLVRDPQGQVVINQSTGYPTLAPNSVNAGRTTPKFTAGMTSTLSYKNFSFQVTADYRWGYVFYNNAEQSLDFTGASQHTATNGRQNFIFPNSVIETSSGKYVKNTGTYTNDGSIGFWVYSDYRGAGTSYVMNGAVLKVRSASIAYDFSPFLKNNKYIKGATFTILGNDLLMFRPKENNFSDPEMNYSNSNGYGYNTYYQLPPTRKISFVVKFTF